MKKYNIIYADPPWSYNDKSLKRGGAERHYKTVSNKNLCELNVNEIASDNCILFMWATFPKIQAALNLIEAWGFTYKTNAFTWVKRNKVADSLFWGMGRWTRSNAEICLLAVKGKPKRVDMGVHSVVEAKIMKHSKKPLEVGERIVKLCGDVPRIELFARNKTDGWDVWGDEIESDINLTK